MSMKRIIISIIILSAACSAAAQTNKYQYFSKGAYCDVEASFGLETAEMSADYSLKMSAGYRVAPQLAVAIGIGGMNTLRDGVTSAPVFIKFRSDLLDRKVSPYMAAEVGYTFMFNTCKNDHSKLHVNDRYTNEGVLSETGTDVSMMSDEEMHEVIESYITGLKTEWTERLKEMGMDESRIEDEVNRIASRSRSAMQQLPDGRNTYLETTDLPDDRMFSRQGLYADLQAGVSVKAGDGHRVSFGVAVGFSGYTSAVMIRNLDNSFDNYARTYTHRDGKEVIITGHDPIRKRARMHAGLVVGFSF